MKKAISIIGILLIVLICGMALYFGWRYLSEPTIPTSDLSAEKIAEMPLPPRLKIISPGPVFDYWLNSSTNNLYYLKTDGRIYKTLLGERKEEEQISSQEIENLSYIKANKDGSLVLVVFGYPFEPIFSIFNILDKSWQPLPKTVSSADWNPQNSQQITYLKTNPDKTSSLIIFNLTDKKAKEVAKFNQGDLNLEWIKPNEIFLTQKPSAFILGSVWSFNIETKTVRPLIQDEPGLMTKWSSNIDLGLKFINSFLISPKNILQLINQKGQLLASMPFATLPSKCLISDESIYCAAPSTMIPQEVVLPDDYLKNKIYFRDDIYSTDLNDQQESKIFDGALMPIDVAHLTKINNQLFFINRYDKKLYSLEL